MESTSKQTKVRLSNIVEKWSASTLFLFISIKFLLFFYVRIPRAWKDGWRRTTEAHHRTEESKYFGNISNVALKTDINTPQQIQEFIIQKLHSVFKTIPEMYYSLRWNRFAAVRIPNKHIDFMAIRLAEEGRLNSLTFYPDGIQSELNSADKALTFELLERIVISYNRTLHLPDKKRSLTLYRDLDKWRKSRKFKSHESYATSLLDRMMSANWILFREVEDKPEIQFYPYFFQNQKTTGMGIANILVNVSYTSKWADLWIQLSHICIDGRIGSKILKKIKNEFGSYEPDLLFPESYVTQSQPVHFKYPDRNVFCEYDFIDFRNLLEKRKKLKEGFGNVLPISLLVWGLMHHSLFKEMKFNVPVDISKHGDMERTVGFVFTKPSFFLKGKSNRAAFEEYLDSFNNQIQNVRNRIGENYLFLQTAAIIPHWMIVLILRLMPKALFAFTGTCCITLVEGCECVFPPLSDNITSCIVVSLPQGRHRTLGCVGVKSYSNNTREILEALKDIVENFEKWIRFEDNLSDKSP